MPAGEALNLSNEVVKMRGEVKRVKVLIIRKLTRQILALKKKKGTEADLERNQRRAARLLEEIHELKALAPDRVTKAALQSDISFEKVCQNKDSSLSERATARIATHPEFSRRIQSIKNAIEAFKAERTSEMKKEKKSRDLDQQERESKRDSDDEEGSDDDDDDDRDDGSAQKVQKADEEKLKEPPEQNKDPAMAKEVCWLICCFSKLPRLRWSKICNLLLDELILPVMNPASNTPSRGHKLSSCLLYA